jgi:hypothetical protein
MRIFKTKQFRKLADSEGLKDKPLKSAVDEVRQGLVDAQLGGNLAKKRIAIGGKGKRGGVRTILALKSPTADVFCIYVFAKNQRDNITEAEEKQLRQFAKTLLNMSEAEIQKALTAGALHEVNVSNDN